MWSDLEISGLWWVAHVAATWALVGLIWTVQLAVYPSFAWADPARFAQWHADYTRRIGMIVGPLMGIEAVTGVIWVWTHPEVAWAWVGLGLIGTIWVGTAVVQVPIHRRLGRRWDRELIALLVKGNWVRTVVWTARGVLVVAVSWG